MGVIFNIEEALHNSAFNILQEPIKMILENETEAFEKESIIPKVFVMKTSDKYREEYLRSRLSLLQGMYDHIKDELKASALALITNRMGNDELLYIKDPHNQLSSRVRNFYGMLQGERLATLKYKTFNLIRCIYRKLR